MICWVAILFVCYPVF